MSERNGLRIKTFFAPTVEGAMEAAFRELGPDALLMNSRNAPVEAKHLGEYEVVFGVPPTAPPGFPAAPEATVAGPAEPGWELLCRELTELRAEMRQMKTSVRRYGDQKRGSLSPRLIEALEDLMNAGVDPSLVPGIIEGVQRRCVPTISPESPWAGPDGEAEGIDECLRAEIEERIQVDPELDASGGDPRCLMFVGPPGVGKTTTLAKVAVTYGLASNRSVRFISMDTARIAANEQLRAYAGILGVGFEMVDSTRALQRVITESSSRGLILIDTPGYCSANLEDAFEIARGLRALDRVDVQLVLSACMKFSDGRRAVERFEIFRPSRLIFTKLDETVSLGSIFSIAAQSRKKISYLTAGPSIPEDLQPATVSRILEGLLPGAEPRLSVTAA